MDTHSSSLHTLEQLTLKDVMRTTAKDNKRKNKIKRNSKRCITVQQFTKIINQYTLTKEKALQEAEIYVLVICMA